MEGRREWRGREQGTGGSGREKRERREGERKGGGEEGMRGWKEELHSLCPHAVSYHEEDGLDPATKLATGLGRLGIHQQVGWDTLDSHTLVPGQHPDDHVWNTVLGLE